MSQMSDLGQSAKDHVKDLGAQAKETATQEAAVRAEDVKDQAADKVQQAANAADAAALQFDPASPQAQAVNQVAEHIEDVAAKLRSADVRDLADQATDFARRNPALFIGAAALAGFAAARFLKASAPDQIARETIDPWGTPAGGQTHG